MRSSDRGRGAVDEKYSSFGSSIFGGVGGANGTRRSHLCTTNNRGSNQCRARGGLGGRGGKHCAGSTDCTGGHAFRSGMRAPASRAVIASGHSYLAGFMVPLSMAATGLVAARDVIKKETRLACGTDIITGATSQVMRFISRERMRGRLSLERRLIPLGHRYSIQLCLAKERCKFD
jgi:hypothetical protein